MEKDMKVCMRGLVMSEKDRGVDCGKWMGEIKNIKMVWKHGKNAMASLLKKKQWE